MSIKSKFLLIYILGTVIPLAVIGSYVFSGAKGVLERITQQELNTVAEFKESELFLYLNKLSINTRDYASDGYIRENLAALNTTVHPDPAIQQQLSTHLIKNKLAINPELTVIDVIDRKGIIAASTERGRIGRDVSTTSYFLHGIKGPYISDIHKHHTKDNETETDLDMEIELSAPLRSWSNPEETIGVLLNHYSGSILSKILSGENALKLGAKTQYRGIGVTGEVYMVNSEKLIMNDSLFTRGTAFKLVVDTYPVNMGLEENREVNGVWKDYRGVSVVGASMVINVDNHRWILISEIDADEAFAEVGRLKNISVIVSIIILFFILASAFLIERTVTTPIRRLKMGVDQIRQGELGCHLQFNSNDEIGFLASAFNDMTDHLLDSKNSLEEQNRRLVEMSIKDGLTEVYNHRYLRDALNTELQRAERYNTPFSCLMIDIDYFKVVNDTYGHLFGDYVLHNMAKILKNISRQIDIVGRYGGEEFMILLPNTDMEHAVEMANKILTSVREHHFSQVGRHCQITVSIGISEYGESVIKDNDLIEQADSALYQAKKQGRNQICKYNDGMITCV
jgi:diguanylate cyclase (GGDEF)-like protein